jgi:hypothetical protein
MNAVPKRRRFQFSLRAIFVLMSSTAVFFSVARNLGYVDAVIILAALSVLLGIALFPRRVHLTTGVLLAITTATLLWANLRTTQWEREWGEAPPSELDPVTYAMFWHGWPLAPFMVCDYHGMKFHAYQPNVLRGTLVIDGVLFIAVLSTVRNICEMCIRWLGALVPHCKIKR